MSNKKTTTSFEYLGLDYQERLLSQILKDKVFSKSILAYLKPNYFSNETLKLFTQEIVKAYTRDDVLLDITALKIRLYENNTKEEFRAIIDAYIDKIKECPSTDWERIQERAFNFCKQQEVMRITTEMQQEIKKNNLDSLVDYQDELTTAFNIGIKEINYSSDFDDIDDLLSDDYRDPTPTGIEKLDNVMNGGLASGELAIVLAALGVGKAQPLHSKVLTPNGWTTIGEMKVGDVVTTPNGGTGNVIGVYPQGKRPVFELKFSDGTKAECDINHLWKVKRNTSKKYKVLKLEDIINDLRKNEDAYYSVPTLTHKGSLHREHQKRIQEIIKGVEPINGIYTHVMNDMDVSLELIKLLSSIGSDVIDVENTILKNGDLSTKVTFKLTDLADSKKISYIRYIKDMETQCIMLDTDDHLYITDDYTVTHNTTIATKIANTAYGLGKKVLQIFFEDPTAEIKRKHLACWSGIPINELRLHKEQVKEVSTKKNSETTGKLILMKLSSLDTTMVKIRDIVRDLKQNGDDIDMILIDYIDCVQPSRHHSDPLIGEAMTMREFENLLSEFGMAGYAFTQGNRSAIGSKVVDTDQMGGSIKKAQIGHFILSIARPIEQKKENKATFGILKSRFGRDGIIYDNVIFNNMTLEIEILPNTDGSESFVVAPKHSSDVDSDSRIQEIIKRMEEKMNPKKNF